MSDNVSHKEQESTLSRPSSLTGSSTSSKLRRSSRSSIITWVIGFDGTLMDSLSPSRSTIVAALPGFIHVDERYERVIPLTYGGVGTNGGTVDLICGTLFGKGFTRKVIHAYEALSLSYQPGDRIIIDGYSRGAFAARAFAALLELLGLPSRDLRADKRKAVLRKTKKMMKKQRLWDEGVVDEIKTLGKDHWHHYVSIDALCLFDTVAALGLPQQGIAALPSKAAQCLKFSRGHGDLEQRLRQIPPNVKHAYQALAIQEYRATYKEQLATISIATSDNGERCLTDAVLAWILGRLHKDLKLQYNQNALYERFPGCDKSAVSRCCKRRSSETSSLASLLSASSSRSPSTGSSSPGAESTTPVRTDWLKGPMKKTGRVPSFIHGKKLRLPGHRAPTRQRAMEQVSPAVRLRGHGRDGSDHVLVPGYRFDEGTGMYKRVRPERQPSIFGGSPLRVNSDSSSSSSFSRRSQSHPDMAPPFLEEAVPTVLEDALLRYSEMTPR